MSGIITPGQSKLVLHNRSEPYELTYNIAKRWGNNKSRIGLISESGSKEQAVPQISQTFHFLNVIPRGKPIWKAFTRELLLLSQLRVQSTTLEEKIYIYVYIYTSYIRTYIYMLHIYAHKAEVCHLIEVTGSVLLPCRHSGCVILAIPLLKGRTFHPAPVSLLHVNSRTEVCRIYI